MLHAAASAAVNSARPGPAKRQTRNEAVSETGPDVL
jgi:hypothetical protein